MSATRQVVGLVLSVLVCFAAAGLGSVWTAKSVGTWYQALEKPSWNPPNWLFGPVWSVLYLLMGIALWLVWRRTGLVAAPIGIFAVQLVLNAAWSGLFFGLQNPGAAFAEIVVLWVAIVATIVAFWRITPVAGILLLPYIAWVSFAGALNFTIWRLNA
jgi:benzodiazapine receptor